MYFEDAAMVEGWILVPLESGLIGLLNKLMLRQGGLR